MDAAATQGLGKPDATLEPFARAFLREELDELELATRIATDVQAPGSRAPQATSDGIACPIALTCAREANLDYIGVALLGGPDS